MSVILQGYQLDRLNFGTQVIKAAQAFPQTQTLTLYTVTGGLILVTALIGQVTTATTTDPGLTLGCGTPTVGGTLDTDGIATTTALTSAEVGTLVTVAASSGLPGALVVGTLAGSAAFLAGAPFVVNSGTITWTTSASHAGQMKWWLSYVPIDIGASVS
ncbi:MAG TPA: hypothetical protein VIX86_06780 [Streptosporangiaceae bacterium]